MKNIQEFKRYQLMPAHEQLVLLLDELSIQMVAKTDKGYILYYGHPDHGGIDVDMEDFR